MRLSELQALFEDVALSPPTDWKKVRGPLGAASLELDRLAWKWPEAFVFEDPLDMRYSLLRFSPAFLKRG